MATNEIGEIKMLDFMKVTLKKGKRKDEGVICPVFLAKRSKDLMIRGGHFYAIWDEEAGLWSTDEYRAYEIIDKEIREYVEKNNYIGSGLGKENISVAYMWDTSKNAVDDWIKYTQRQLCDNYHSLDDHITFARLVINSTWTSSRTRKSFPTW